MGAIVVHGANTEFRLVKREVKNGMTSVPSYLLATSVLQVPYFLLLSLSSLMVPYYGLANANTDGMALGVLVMAVTLWSFEQASLFFALCFENPVIGMLMALGLWFVNFLFCGAFLQPEFVSWPFRFLCDVVAFRWTLSAMQYLSFHGTTWEGAVDSGNSTIACPGAPLGSCYGVTGDQVLDKLSYMFPVSSEDRVYASMFYIFLYGAFFKCLHVVIAVVKTSFSHQTPRPRKIVVEEP